MKGVIQRATAEYVRRLFIRRESGGMWERHHQGVEPFTPSSVARGRSVAAFVQASRWVVRCPSPLCVGAQLACPEFPRFFCVECLNADVDNHWIEVLWPVDRDIEAIEAALLVRPHFVTRSWNPDETVGWLIAENHAADLVDVPGAKVLGDTGHRGLILPAERRLSLAAGSP